MQKQFKKIKKRYDEFYDHLLKNGMLPMMETSKGFWGAAVTDEIFELFKKIDLSKFNHLLDLGSGDGKIVLIATLFGIKATGFECDKWLVDNSLNIQKSLSNISNINNARFIHKDFHEHDIKDYDVIFLNPDKPLHRGLEKKLLEDMNGKLILYGPHFHPVELKKDETFNINGTEIATYRKAI